MNINNSNNPPYKKSKLPDNTLLGFLIGLIFPILGIVLLYFFWGDGNMKSYFAKFFNTKNPADMRSASKIMSLSMFAMLIPFNIFINKKKYLTTRGIILATSVFAILIILYNFVWQ